MSYSLGAQSEPTESARDCGPLSPSDCSATELLTNIPRSQTVPPSRGFDRLNGLALPVGMETTEFPAIELVVASRLIPSLTESALIFPSGDLGLESPAPDSGCRMGLDSGDHWDHLSRRILASRGFICNARSIMGCTTMKRVLVYPLQCEPYSVAPENPD